MITPYKETHQQGYISIEQSIGVGVKEGDFGIQVSKDGRVWVCLDGIALIRFQPKRGGRNAKRDRIPKS